MIAALTVSSFSVSNGMVHIRYSDGDGEYISRDELDRRVQRVKQNWQEIALVALLLRADDIDPAHGAQFVNAMEGKTLTINTGINNLMVRSNA